MGRMVLTILSLDPGQRESNAFLNACADPVSDLGARGFGGVDEKLKTIRETSYSVVMLVSVACSFSTAVVFTFYQIANGKMVFFKIFV